jgi:glutathione S-transferase
MSLKLYDLAGADSERRFSPYCWRSKFAIAHKGLTVQTIPWRFTEKDAIAFSGQGRVPVLVAGGRHVFDSWAIAEYLEDTYPARPSLFGGASAKAASRFINAWADSLVPLLAPLVAIDIFAHLHEKDRKYFRESRESRFGTTLEQASAERETKIKAFRDRLEPMRATLTGQSYLGGEAPNYADYIVFGVFQWARCISALRLLVDDDPVAMWRGRLLQAFDGLAAKAVGYSV